MTSEMPPTIIETVVYFFYVDRNVLYGSVMVGSRALMAFASWAHSIIIYDFVLFAIVILVPSSQWMFYVIV